MTTERNDGKRLEQLVEMLEGMKLPEGFTIEKNSPVYNDEGQQIAELDILISGKIGSVFHKTLFECRDRPSQGAAPVGWIEQLFGRKQRLKLSAIVAVSTTGFAPGAVEFAKQENIPLRSVEALTEDEIRGFLSKTAPLWETEANFSDVHIVAIPEDTPTDFESMPHTAELVQQTKIATAERFFLNLETNKSLSMKELWHHVQHIQQVEIFGDVPMDWQFVPKTVEAIQSIKDKFRIVHDDYRGKIHKLTFTATVRHRWSPMPLVEAVTYGGSDEPQSVVATWEGGTDKVAKIVVILRKRDKLA